MADEPVGGGDDLIRDDEDHDLLTFSEGGIRLREEIALTEAALTEAVQREQPTETLRARLAALTEALERNTRQARANPGESGFLSYVPPRPTRPDSGQEGPA